MTIGNLWWVHFSNVGNGFINWGAQLLLEELIDDTIWRCNLQDPSWPNVMFVSGAYGTSDIDTSASKVIWNGVGMFRHTDRELDGWAKAAENVEYIITREDRTYRRLCERGIPAKPGVDMAWFLCDYIEQRPYDGEPYTVWSVRGADPPDDIENVKVVTHDWTGFSIEEIVQSPVKDNIWDYVSIYANAEYVITDRVHGTIMALQYETPVTLMRGHMDSADEFGRAGCIEVGCSIGDVGRGQGTVNWNKLNRRKEQHVEYLTEAITKAGVPVKEKKYD